MEINTALRTLKVLNNSEALEYYGDHMFNHVHDELAKILGSINRFKAR